ncbi:MAG: zinc ABC transporter substrate-binding protein [Muribaculaceae bacterium]|nr:zinc ABC transporter substrate-binding protein [Muribaculaceae bacterium]
MIKNLILGAVAMAVIAWLFSACSGATKRSDGSGSRPLIAVSIPPQLFFIKAIAGDRVDTFCLLESSADPESFEPSMNQLVALEKAAVYLPMGELAFEKSLIDKLKANNSSLEIEKVTEGIVPLEGTHSHHDGHHSHDVDPHMWSSAVNGKIIALNTLNALIKADSKNEDVYRANYGRLEQRIDSIDSCFREVFSRPDVTKSFIVWHPSLSYFARDYGLTQLALSMSGKESSVKGMIDRMDAIKSSGAEVYFYQKEFDNDRAKSIARETDTNVVEINPMNEEWEDEMQKLYDAFTVN